MATRSDDVLAAVDAVDRALHAHRGGVRLVSDPADPQAIELELTGMCTGCPYWPVTMVSTIRPIIERRVGPVEVSLSGRRVSEQALQRLASIAPKPALIDNLLAAAEREQVR